MSARDQLQLPWYEGFDPNLLGFANYLSYDPAGVFTISNNSRLIKVQPWEINRDVNRVFKAFPRNQLPVVGFQGSAQLVFSQVLGSFGRHYGFDQILKIASKRLSSGHVLKVASHTASAQSITSKVRWILPCLISFEYWFQVTCVVYAVGVSLSLLFYIPYYLILVYCSHACLEPASKFCFASPQSSLMFSFLTFILCLC